MHARVDLRKSKCLAPEGTAARARGFGGDTSGLSAAPCRPRATDGDDNAGEVAPVEARRKPRQHCQSPRRRPREPRLSCNPTAHSSGIDTPTMTTLRWARRSRSRPTAIQAWLLRLGIDMMDRPKCLRWRRYDRSDSPESFSQPSSGRRPCSPRSPKGSARPPPPPARGSREGCRERPSGGRRPKDPWAR